MAALSSCSGRPRHLTLDEDRCLGPLPLLQVHQDAEHIAVAAASGDARDNGRAVRVDARVRVDGDGHDGELRELERAEVAPRVAYDVALVSRDAAADSGIERRASVVEPLGRARAAIIGETKRRG